MNYINGLFNKNPNYSSKQLWDKPQYFNITILVLYIIFLYFTGYIGLVLSLNTLAFTFFLYKLILTIIGIKNNEKERLADNNLPTYCILLPVRNEPIEVINNLISNICDINYPKELLDVKLLIDEDDKHLSEVKLLDLPSHFSICSAPTIYPFTKPKVCNLGLSLTSAEFVTIYDVEDKPDTDQLLKVVASLYKRRW